MFKFSSKINQSAMWVASNFLGYFSTAVICSVIFLLFLRIFNNLLNISENNHISSTLHIVEITSRQKCREACVLLKAHCQDLNALGFDCEWVTLNGTQRPVALIQLATVHGFCCLFRLNILGYIPTELKEILQNSQILKLGISPLNDSKLLQKDYNVQVCSTLDLRYLYPKGGGLASLAASVINVNLDKSWHLQCSNWESPKLTDSQRDYAAKDAFVAVEIFKKWLLSKNNAYTLYHLKTSYSNLLTEELISEINRYLDINFKQNHTQEKIKKEVIIPECNYNQNQKKLKSGYVTRKAPLYHNCFMLAPDGQLLCSCDRRKAQWYIERGLAEVLPGEPYSIRLLFEPAARGGETSEGRFYQQLKQNCCVVCGALQSYLKHNVVPKEYRKHFPNIMKDHQSHDIVLMCIRCHHLAAQHNKVQRQKLAILCNAPIKTSKISYIRTIQKVKNSAKALLLAGDIIPTEKKTLLEDEVKRFYEVHVLTKDILRKGANLSSKVINENYEGHGIKVVNYFIQKGGGLTKLEILWREHFLNTMKPQYLPALWSITHNHSRLAGYYSR